MADTIESLKKQINDLKKEYQNLTGKPAALFEVKNIEDAEKAIRTLNGSLKNAYREAEKLEKGFGGVYSEIQSILGELNKSENAANKVTKAFKGVERIARDLKDDQQGYNKLSLKDLELRQAKLISAQTEINLQAKLVKSQYEGGKYAADALLQNEKGKFLSDKKIKDRAKELGISEQQLRADAEILGQQEKGFRVIRETNQLLKDRIDKENRINESLGLGGAIIGSMKGALDKLGMGGLADKLGFDEASKKMRKLTEELTNGGETTLDFAGKTKVLKSGFGSMRGNLIKNLTDPLSIGLMLVGQLVDAFKAVDKMTGDIANNLGMSYSEANNMVSSMSDIANSSLDTYVNTKGLVQAQLELSKILGTNATFSGELLVDFTKLNTQAGYSVETLTQLSKITLSTGGDLSDNTAEILGTAKAFNAVNKLALNEKEIVAEVAKTSAATVLIFGKSYEALTKNVMAAKQFGLNLEQAEKISSNLLDFQSSIQAEMSAEILTGKSLNFEQARFLALQGKTGEAAALVAQQMGSAEDFGNLLVTSQEALAKAAGMTRDELANSLIEREALVAAGMENLTLEEAYAELKKQGLSDEAIAARLGNETLEDQLKSESVQKRMIAATEKLKEAFISLALPVMEFVSPIVDLLIPAISSIAFILTPVFDMFKGMSAILTGSWDTLNAWETTMGAIGIIAGGLLIATKSIAFYNGLIKAYQIAQVALENTKGLAIFKTIGAMTVALGIQLGLLSASLATNAAVTFGVGVAVAVAAAMAGYAAIKSMTADDMISQPGYGSRTLMGPEGAIALNDNDTVIAGTDLFPKEKDNKKVGASNSINIAPLVEQMNKMNATLSAILGKEGTVTLDGTKVGTALTVGSYKLQ